MPTAVHRAARRWTAENRHFLEVPKKRTPFCVPHFLGNMLGPLKKTPSKYLFALENRALLLGFPEVSWCLFFFFRFFFCHVSFRCFFWGLDVFFPPEKPKN